MIIVNAHRINKGDYPILNEKDKDFFFMDTGSTQETLATILDLVQDRLPKYYGVDSLRDIQVLSPMRRGEVGINSLNKHLQEVLNPKDDNWQEKQVGDEIFRIGDKVMQVKNNYKLKWNLLKDGEEVDTGEGVFNGDLGFITDINNEESIVTVLSMKRK